MVARPARCHHGRTCQPSQDCRRMPRSKTDWSKVKPVGWARVWSAAKPAVSRNLRKGTWYPVLLDQKRVNAVLDIGGTPTVVPRRLLEIREGHHKPKYFEVVWRTPKERARTRKSRHGSEPLYVVCPQCAWRQPFHNRGPGARCPKCRFVGKVAWWEIVSVLEHLS